MAQKQKIEEKLKTKTD